MPIAAQPDHLAAAGHVHVAGSDDHVEPAVAVQVDDGRARPDGVVDERREAAPLLAGKVPHVQIAVPAGDDDLQRPVVVEVRGYRRAEYPDDRLGVDRGGLPEQDRAVGAKTQHLATGAGGEHVERPVAVEVDEGR